MAISINRLPDNLLFKVLEKVELGKIARFRQCCRYLDSFVEHNRSGFSKRNSTGFYLYLEDENGNLKLEGATKEDRFNHPRTNLLQPYLQFSAIPIRRLYICLDKDITEQALAVLTYVLKFLRISANLLQINILRFPDDNDLSFISHVNYCKLDLWIRGQICFSKAFSLSAVKIKILLFVLLINCVTVDLTRKSTHRPVCCDHAPCCCPECAARAKRLCFPNGSIWDEFDVEEVVRLFPRYEDLHFQFNGIQGSFAFELFRRITTDLLEGKMTYIPEIRLLAKGTFNIKENLPKLGLIWDRNNYEHCFADPDYIYGMALPTKMLVIDQMHDEYANISEPDFHDIGISLIEKTPNALRRKIEELTKLIYQQEAYQMIFDYIVSL